MLQNAAGQWVVPNELGSIYDRNGAVGFNASTGKDVTNYMVSFPANRLPLWVAVESDRMANPVLREFYKERDVVLEERRRSVETSPGGKLYEAFLATAFVAHPYGNPTLGWPSDVESLSATETREFLKPTTAQAIRSLPLWVILRQKRSFLSLKIHSGKSHLRPRHPGLLPSSRHSEVNGVLRWRKMPIHSL